MLHPYWRLLMHMFLMCLYENRGGNDQLNQVQLVAFVFENMKMNLDGVRKEMFLIYPIYIQMILNTRYPDLEKSNNIMDLKPMGGCFGVVKQVRQTGKVKLWEEFHWKSSIVFLKLRGMCC
ncbi:hypothetical protein Hanom_Chr11g01006751 [Helianthus anomalus]